ncbi:Retrotransposon-derived PEG10 [Labeo rohita]|uniref:Retrotransposon-derived PEG10 n=1 Tax=Labeo rohita TaxID=84645 RepID=A0A498LNY2_LABRO|nr:Retrotransposon-derived PEG10 [Labeo rohita]
MEREEAAAIVEPYATFLQILHEAQPGQFPTDRSKIALIITLLMGRALRWAEALWTSKSPHLGSLDLFLQHFRQVFGQPVTPITVQEELLQLHQGKLPIHEYILRFRILSLTSGWNDSALLAVFRRGLNTNIRQQMAIYEDNVGLDAFLKRAVTISQHLTACETPVESAPSCTSTEEPMHTDTYHLTAQERTRRLQGGLCLYCGAPSHLLLQCSVRPAKSTDIVSNLRDGSTKNMRETPRASERASVWGNSLFRASMSFVVRSSPNRSFLDFRYSDPLAFFHMRQLLVIWAISADGAAGVRRSRADSLPPVAYFPTPLYVPTFPFLVNLLTIMDSAEETELRRALSQQGVLLGRQQEELEASRHACAEVSLQLSQLVERLDQLQVSASAAQAAAPVPGLERAVSRHAEPRLNPPAPYSESDAVVPSARAFVQRCLRTWRIAREALTQTGERNKALADHHRIKPPPYVCGQKVWLSSKDINFRLPSRKLGPKFVGPFIITKVLSLVTVRLKLTPQFKKIHPVFHVSKIKPIFRFPPSTPDLCPPAS